MTTSYDNTTAPNGAGSGTFVVPVNSFIPGLVQGKTYHYRFIAGNSAGTNFGGDQTFTLAAFPPRLIDLNTSNGVFQFSFTNNSGLSLSVLATTNLARTLSNWTLVDPPVEGPAGFYQVTDSGSVSNTKRFYRVSWP